MKWHPLLCAAPMVVSIKARRKFVTRRTSASWLKVKRGDGLYVRETFCIVNDTDTGGDKWIDYRATPRYSSEHPAGWENAPDDPEALKWKPSIHMPRSASRFSLIATADAYRERLQDITEEQAIAEGCTAVSFERWYEGMKPLCNGGRIRQQSRGIPPSDWTEIRELRETTGSDFDPLARSAIEDFRSLVNSLHGPKFWDSNPDVTVIPFDYPEEATL